MYDPNIEFADELHTVVYRLLAGPPTSIIMIDKPDGTRRKLNQKLGSNTEIDLDNSLITITVEEGNKPDALYTIDLPQYNITLTPSGKVILTNSDEKIRIL